MPAQHHRYEIPRELQEILLDFTVHYLVEQPTGDVVDFALEYFTRLHSSRRSARVAALSDDDSMLSDDEVPSNGGPAYVSTRRKSVFAETYDPEEDEQDEKPVVHPKSDGQRKSLMDAVKEILLFRSLDKEQLNQVLDAMFERHVVAGDYIIRQGDDGDNFYVVDSGVYNIFVKGGDGKENLVGKCENKGSFGELALMYNMPRAATIQAATDGMVWAMDRHTFRRIVLRNAFQKRKMYEALIENVPLLNALNSYERMNLADALAPKTFADGLVIVRQGDLADGMYFIESGKVIVSIAANDGSEKIVTTVQKGGYFGELALVTHKPRAATVKAEGDVRVAFLDVNAFERLLGPCMDIMKRNIDDYENQLVRIFGTKAQLSELR